MACKTCPGSARRTRARELVSNTTMLFGSGPKNHAENIMLVLYKSSNRAMHNVYSPTRPLSEDGKIVSGYGRRRGATETELELYEAGKLNRETANSIKAMGYSVFYVHEDDVAARPQLFLPIEDAVEPAAKEVKEDKVVPEDDDLTIIYGVTAKVEEKLKQDGYRTIAAVKDMEDEELAKYLRATKKATQLERAKMAKESIK